MGEFGVAALFMTLAVIIVLSGPARLLQFLKMLVATLRGAGARRKGREAAGE